MKVHTTLDIDVQHAAEESLERRLTALEQRNQYKKTRAALASKSEGSPARDRNQTEYLQGAVVSMDPASGQILALVGGRDFNDSNFNRAIQAARQPGSAFKPFIYTAAIDNGFSPTDIILDTPVSFRAGNGEDWSPQNYDKKFRGPVTLRNALANSVNVPAAKLLQKLGISVVTSYAKRMGIKSRLTPDLSLALGTSEVKLDELTSAYGVYANQGVRTTPTFILKVEDKNGKILEESHTTAEEVLSPETVGYVPGVVTGVWVGFDRKQRIGPGMTGAAAALPIWVDVMMAATKGRPAQDFPVPSGVVSRLICTETGLLANPACPSTEIELFREGSEPTGYCNVHTGTAKPPTETPDFHETDTEAPPDERLKL